jgi:hypothetical protein
MRLLVAFLTIAHLLTLASERSEASESSFGFGAGPDFAGSAIAGAGKPGTALEGFMAWPISPRSRLLLAVEWTRFSEDKLTSQLDGVPKSPGDRLTSKVDMMRIVLTERWFHQEAGPIRSWVGIGFGVCDIVKSRRDSPGILLRPSLGFALHAGLLTVGLESGCELVFADGETFPIIPIRLRVSF